MDPITEPRWRALAAEAYLQRYTEATNKGKELKSILKAEKDGLVKDYLTFRIRQSAPATGASKSLGRFPQREGLAYARDCLTSSNKTFRASMIRAMAVAGRTTEEIAAEFDTLPINISVFLELFFDVRPLLRFDALL